jgi:hypothetical protein
MVVVTLYVALSKLNEWVLAKHLSAEKANNQRHIFVNAIVI